MERYPAGHLPGVKAGPLGVERKSQICFQALICEQGSHIEIAAIDLQMKSLLLPQVVYGQLRIQGTVAAAQRQAGPYVATADTGGQIACSTLSAENNTRIDTDHHRGHGAVRRETAAAQLQAAAETICSRPFRQPFYRQHVAEMHRCTIPH